MNSLALLATTESFDAIWMDGDHTNPVVTLDLGQVVRLVRPGGLIALDDIRLPGAWHKAKGSDEAYRALEVLRQAHIIDYDLIHKRLTEHQLLIPQMQRFIAVVRRTMWNDPLI